MTVRSSGIKAGCCVSSMGVGLGNLGGSGLGNMGTRGGGDERYGGDVAGTLGDNAWVNIVKDGIGGR